jgi:hypothetical protein
MRKLFEKAGSLLLGMGALGLLLTNAAMTHGCASSPPQQATPGGNASGIQGDPSADPDCEVPEYLYATKAPVWSMLPPKCRGGTGPNVPAQAQEPTLPAEAQQQAP